MSIEELKKRRDEIVSAALAEQPKSKSKRKRGERPPDAKIPGLSREVPESEKAEEPPEPAED